MLPAAVRARKNRGAGPSGSGSFMRSNLPSESCTKRASICNRARSRSPYFIPTLALVLQRNVARPHLLSQLRGVRCYAILLEVLANTSHVPQEDFVGVGVDVGVDRLRKVYDL